MSEVEDASEDQLVEYIQAELSKTFRSTKGRVFTKFALAALGSIPWVGGFISAAASLKAEEGDIRADDLRTQWLEEHAQKMNRLSGAFEEIDVKFESLGGQIDERIESEEYLDLVRRAFRAWDRSDTDEKRKYIADLISNAAGTKLCSDDVVRLFINWIDSYHEAHFAVIREIYKNPGSTRLDIWESIHGEIPREDSADADLYRLLIRDLSTGGVIRQARPTTPDGRFLRKKNPRRRRPAPATTESSFEDTKPYVLTELGKQFVHYTMTEIVPRISADEGQGENSSGMPGGG